MKKIFLCCCLPFVVLLFLSLRMSTSDKIVSPREELAIGCAPSSVSGDIRPDAEGRYAPVFPGWGHYHYLISTSSDSAQYYFDQGLNLYYSYHLKESLASFKEAARRDSNCVMAYWGQALAMGPYYNDTYYYKMPLGVLPVLSRMRQLAERPSGGGSGRTGLVAGEGAGQLSDKEKDLVAALGQKYSTDTTDSHRTDLNRAYSESMLQLVGKYPRDPDVKALYIDGVMIEHAWDMWDTKGVAKPWTMQLVNYCNEILKASPYHPAALHFHIHLLEASFHPEETVSSADRLKDLMPGVAHMVHMSSHSYQRTGLYEKGVFINDSASAAQSQYSSIAPQLLLASHVIHYSAVEAYCAMSGGMYVKAMQAADECERIAAANPATPTGLYLQYLYMMPVFAQVRMGKWQAILERPVPDGRWRYARCLSDFARGLAFVRTGKTEAAQACLDSLRDKLQGPVLAVRRPPNNAPIEGASVAAGILEGELLFARKKPDEAFAAFERAMIREDGMSYAEPTDWPLPVRHFSGAHLLQLDRAAEAEQLYREELVHNPGSGWSYLGLSKSLDAQHKNGADEYRAKARKVFASADRMPEASAY